MKSKAHASLLLVGALLLTVLPAQAANDRTILYLDGARIEQTVSARKGGAAVLLPVGMVPGSLRVEPLAGAIIDRVSIGAPPSGKDLQREQRALSARHDNLEDRLTALAMKEDIYKAAAKSQSGKAPKRTKTNPDPLATIRQGTDYAVAQLEAVYRSRRTAERELREVKQRLAVLSGDPATVGSLARVTVHGGELIRISYLVRDRNWLPRYDLRFVATGKAELVLLAEPGNTTVIPALMSAPLPAKELAVAANGVVTTMPCSVTREDVVAKGQKVVTAELSCSPAMPLPAGKAACYHHGGYLGEVTLAAVSTELPIVVECGAFTRSVALPAGR